ncbi:hypothetical protein ACQY0O_000668 [Thecaphora frezii]
MPRLQVLIGPDRFHMEECRVNDTQRPHEIENEYFVGRVLVRIVDAPGALPGEPGREYFQDRSRKFCIQIEGRFKQRYSGDDILFGSDFDKFIDFPRAPFNAGMRVAKFIDPCTFYEFHPPSGRPYIMSPYIACMNTFCAWPAPSRAHDAVVVLRHTQERSDSADPSRPASPIVEPEKGHGDPHTTLTASPAATDAEEEGDIVPIERLNRSSAAATSAEGAADKEAAKKRKKGWLSGFGMGSGSSAAPKEERVLKRYWRFVGFRNDPRVRALLEAHQAELGEVQQHGSDGGQTSKSHLSVSSGSGSEVQHGPAPQTLSKLGTGSRKELRRFLDRAGTPEHYDGDEDHGLPKSPRIGQEELGTASPNNLESPSSESVPNDRPAPAPALPVSSTTALGTPLGAPDSQSSVKADSASAANATSTSTSASTSASASRSPSQTASTAPSPPVSKCGSSASVPSSLQPSMPPLERISTNVREEMQQSAKTDGLHTEDFKLADSFARASVSASSRNGSARSRLDDALGPWRFEDPSVDLIEDNAFIFTTQSLPVPKRRKYFADVKNRERFEYDPDVVYGASFFTDAMDFNTFNLGIGPVKLNLRRFFTEMPVRYTLRSKVDEDKVMATISFQLVD